MKYLVQVEVMTKKLSKATIIGLRIAGALLLLGIAAAIAISAIVTNRNWDLGLGPQKSTEEIAKVQQAVESVENQAVLDVHVENANTSGQPFGHSIRIEVLADADLLSATDQAAINALGADITRAVQGVGMKDEYYLVIGLDVNTRATSGAGTPENPVTSAEDMFGADDVYRESFEVK